MRRTALAALAPLALLAPAPAAAETTGPLPTGRSAEGRPLRAAALGPADAPVRVLVVGQVHGDEPAGPLVVDRLLARRPPAGVRLVVVRSANPDGARRRSRVNARGVDLNRNFPHRWRRAPRGRFWPGPRAASEPETRWLMALHRTVRPDVTVHLHQPYGFVVHQPDADLAHQRAYARAARLPIRRLPAYRGTAVGWQNAQGGSAFVVELHARRPSRAEIDRHVGAIGAVARLVARSGA